MNYQSLSGMDQPASVIVLGAACYGTEIPEEDALALLDGFVAGGGNFLDTAHMYAQWVPGGAGASETTIGKWLKRNDRSRVLIGTKGADKGMDRQSIRRQLSESLDRLGVDRVDFYWLHTDDPKVPPGDILEWLNELADEGSFGAFGCSNWRVDRMEQAAEYAAAHGVRPFAASQISWSLALANPQVVAGISQVFMDDDTFGWHRRVKMPLVAYSSQAGGFFAGKYDPAGPPPGTQPNANIIRLFGTKENYAKLEAVKKIAAKRGASPNQVALAYLFSQGFPGLAIVGPHTMAQLEDSLGAGNLTLSAAEVATAEGR